MSSEESGHSAVLDLKFPEEAIAKLAAKDEESVEPSKAAGDEEKALFRAEQIRDTIHGVVIWALRVLGAVAIVVVMLRILMLAMPVSWQFIPPEQQGHIDSLFLSGSIAVAISRHLKAVMGWSETQGEEKGL